MTKQICIAAAAVLLALAPFADARNSATKQAKQKAPPTVVVMISKPVDAGSPESRKKNLWAGALLDALTRFRLESVSSLRAIASSGPDKLGGAEKPAYVFNQKYDIDYHAKSIRYSCELVGQAKTPLTYFAELDLPFDKLGRGIDSCLFAMAIKASGGKISPEVVRFFSIPAIGADFKTNKKLGEIIFDEQYSGKPSATDYSLAYQKLLDKNPLQLLAVHACGTGALAALGQAGDSAANRFLTRTEKSAVSIPSLFDLLGDAFTMARQYGNAIAMYDRALRFDGYNAEIMLKMSTSQLIAHRETGAAETYLRIFESDREHYLDYAAKAGRLFSKYGITEKAIKAYTLYLERRRPADREVQRELARLLFSEKNYSGVIALLREQTASADDSREVMRMAAESYCATGQYQASTPILSSLVALEPNNPRFAELAGLSYEKQGEIASAAAMYARYLAAPGSDRSADIAYHTGMLCEQIGHQAEAAARYEANLKLYPEDIRNYERLGFLYSSGKEWDKAQKILETALEFPQPSPELKKELAQTYIAQNRKNHAVLMYQKYCNVVPGDADAVREFGKLLFDQKLYGRAIEVLKQAAKDYPKDFECLYRLGASYVNCNDFVSGCEPLARAHELNRTYVPVLSLLAKCYRSLKRSDNLCGVLKEWSVIEPKNSDVWLELGALYLAKGKAGDATAVLTEAAQLLPLDARPHKLLAQSYERLKNDSMQLFHLKNVCSYTPEDADAYGALSRFYLTRQRFAEAESTLQKAAAINPGDHLTTFKLGELLLNRGAASAAYQALDKAVRAQPDNPLYLAQLSRAASSIGNNSRAQQAVARAIELEPKNARILFLAGCTYKNLGDRDAAERFLKDALARDNSLTECYSALGDLYKEEVKLRLAAANYFTAWEKGGYREDVALNLGVTLTLSEKFGEARDFLETVVLKNPANDEARYRLAAAFCDLGNPKDARETAKGFTRAGLIWSQLANGRIYEQEKNLDAAAISYAVVARLSPSDPFAHEGTARIFAARNQVDSAVFHYAIARKTDSLNMKIAMEMGKVYEQLAETDSALACYDEVNRKYPDHQTVALEIGRLLAERHDCAGAIKVLQQGIRYHPKSAQLYAMLGKQYEISENYEAAIGAYQTAFKTGPKEIDALLQIGNIYNQKLQNSRKAKKYFVQYVKAGGKDDQAMASMKDIE